MNIVAFTTLFEIAIDLQRPFGATHRSAFAAVLEGPPAGVRHPIERGASVVEIVRLVRPYGKGQEGAMLVHGLPSSAVGGLALHGG